MIQQWMVAVTTQQVNQFLPTITVQEQDISHYIVKTSDKKKDEDEKKPERKEDVASTSASPMDTCSPVTSLGAAEVDSPEVRITNNCTVYSLLELQNEVKVLIRYYRKDKEKFMV